MGVYRPCQHSNLPDLQRLYPFFQKETGSASADASNAKIGSNTEVTLIAETHIHNSPLKMEELNSLMKTVGNCNECVMDLISHGSMYLVESEKKCPERAVFYLVAAYERVQNLKDKATTDKVRKLIITTLASCKPSSEQSLLEYFRAYGNEAVINYLSSPTYLIDSLLEHSKIKFSIQDSVSVITECLKQGEKIAADVAGKEIILFLGGTGVGKSTLINYLFGCEMDLTDPKNLGIEPEDSISKRVISVKRESDKKEVAPIGHMRHSQTFLPKVITSDEMGMIFCDCPGFSDNRGPEISIANACTIKDIFSKASFLKVVVLVSIHDLSNKEINIAQKLREILGILGEEKEIIKCKESILLGVTKIGRATDLNPSESLNDLKLRIDSAIKKEFSELNQLINHFFIYDPLNKGKDLEYKGSIEREKILEKIEKLSKIEGSKNTFQASLSSQESSHLTNICEKLKTRIAEELKKENHAEVMVLYRIIKKLGGIGDERINQSIIFCKELIINAFEKKLLTFCQNNQLEMAKSWLYELVKLLILDEAEKQDCISKIQEEINQNYVNQLLDLDTEQRIRLRETIPFTRDNIGDFRREYEYPVYLAPGSYCGKGGRFSKNGKPILEGENTVHVKVRHHQGKSNPFDCYINLEAKKSDIHRSEINELKQKIEKCKEFIQDLWLRCKETYF